MLILTDFFTFLQLLIVVALTCKACWELRSPGPSPACYSILFLCAVEPYWCPSTDLSEPHCTMNSHKYSEHHMYVNLLVNPPHPHLGNCFLMKLYVCEVSLKTFLISPIHSPPGGMVGQRLSDHPDIRKLGFTGSTPIGKQIMKRYDPGKLTAHRRLSDNWILNAVCLRLPVAAVRSVTWRRFLWSWEGSRLSSYSVTVTWTRLFAWWESSARTDTGRGEGLEGARWSIVVVLTENVWAKHFIVTASQM